MTLSALLVLFSGIATWVLGSVVLSSRQQNSGRIPFFVFAAGMGTWAILISLFSVTTSSDLAGWLARGYYVAALILIYGFLLFSISVSRATKYFKRWSPLLFGLPVLALSLLIVLTDNLISNILIGDHNTVELGLDWYLVYCGVFVIYSGLAFWALMSSIAGETVQLRRDQYGLIAKAMCISLPGGAFFNLILPLLGNYELILVGPLFTLPIVIAVFYAIMRHSLFDIRLAFVRTVTYVLSLTTLAIVYSLLALAVSYIVFSQQLVAINQSVVTVFLVLVLSFIFQPVKRFFDQITNQLFYRDNYKSDDFYAELNQVLTSTTELRTLLDRTIHLIEKTLNSTQTFFLIRVNSDQNKFIGTAHHSRLTKREVAVLDEYVNTSEQSIVLTNMLHEGSDLFKIFTKHKIAVALPLEREEAEISYMLLGPKHSRNYAERDIRLLDTIADELVIAIQNALSVQMIEDLNATLQQRVNEATKELRASNKELQRLDAAKDEFVSMASHQLRTPLTSVKGYISMVLEGDAGKLTPMQHKLLQEAFTSSERMVHLINDFLNVSRLQTGKFMIDLRQVDLVRIARQEVDGLQTTANAHDLKLRFRSKVNALVLQIDENKIRQVIMNFIDNAIYYSPRGSTITVEIAVVDGSATLEVHDKGMGVPASEQSRLFTKFYRASNARKQRPDGTGVGLFLAKKVVDSHGGGLIFESEVGKGSTFGFRLPVKQLTSDKKTD